MPATPAVYDVLIAGAGAAGLALAAALASGLGDRATIAVVDSNTSEGDGHLRTVAIAEGPRRLLSEIGAWRSLEARTQAILEMAIMDGRTRDALRPRHLHFAAREGEPLAHMAFSDDVVGALAEVSAKGGVTRVTGRVAGFEARPYVAGVTLDDGTELRARLVVAADGARSKLRALADIPIVGWDYDQSAIVATIAHERDHEGRAEQHFLPAGPFAILPLPGRRSSIVWNESRAGARTLLALDADDLVRQLEFRFTPKLGDIRFASRAQAFPLGLRIARRFVAQRLALIGDAAHLVHPLAGQGLNQGLRDVAALAEVVVARLRRGLDPGDAETLQAYQRMRRFDVAASGLGMDAMNRLFSNDLAPLRFARDFGLRLIDRAEPLKALLRVEAGGAGASAPRLLRGGSL
jgi:2-octaprenyl-6-methoxyphenol hydroxylase